MSTGPRYSVIPFQFFDDTRPKMSHVRVMASLCRHTNRSGWCRLKQASIGDEAGVSRQAVNRALADLVEWGHVEIHEKEKGRSRLYRVIMDCRSEPPDNLPEDDIVVDGVSSPGDIPLSPGDDRGVTPGGDRGVTYRGDSNNEYLTNTKRKDAPAGASEDFGSGSKGKTQPPAAGASRKVYITPSDTSWNDWLQWFREFKPELERQAVATGIIAAQAQRPGRGVKYYFPDRSELPFPVPPRHIVDIAKPAGGAA